MKFQKIPIAYIETDFYLIAKSMLLSSKRSDVSLFRVEYQFNNDFFRDSCAHLFLEAILEENLYSIVLKR